MTETISRTAEKKRAAGLQKLGEELLALAPDQLASLEIPGDLAEAVRFARGLRKKGARRRQLQYIGALMRRVDPEPIRIALDRIHGSKRQAVAEAKRIEAWRSRLVAGDTDLLEELVQKAEGADRQQLRQLVLSARREQAAGKAGRSFRKLYRCLADIAASIP